MGSSINLWVRAEQELIDHHTYALVPETLRDEYLIVMGELAVHGGALNDRLPNPPAGLRERYNQAQQRRHEFFERVIDGNQTAA